jgi:hypothetical protein
LGHSVEALIIPEGLVSFALSELAHTRAIPLGQGLQLLPITDATLDGLRSTFPDVADLAIPEFWKMSGPLARAAERLSLRGPIAYIESEYFGSAGAQAATVWESGNTRMQPA